MDVLGQTVRRNETRRKIWTLQKSCLSYLLLCNKLPQSQWLVTYTRLFAHDSVDVLFGAEPREDCSSPHRCQPSSPGARGSEVPHLPYVAAGLAAGSCHKHASLSSRLARASFFTWWLRNCPFLRSVIHSITSATFCPTRPAKTWEEQETPPSRQLGRHVLRGWGDLQVTVFADNLPQTHLLETTVT